ncbi:lipase member H-like [Culex quinquefasciatus]|uniref:lipase member H-like n=1 Tax=Culex quinquefasciatus TaxID=7176 RepID=UPI0018E2BFAB|nr:lipase member H-like [Culex quinquefasciatus]
MARQLLAFQFWESMQVKRSDDDPPARYKSQSPAMSIVPSALDKDIFFRESGCEGGGGGKFAIVVHGWRGSCSGDTRWVTDLLSNLTVHRGGCLVCMDYSKYSKEDYFQRLVPRFGHVANALAEKLRDLERGGFDPMDGFMFGFSFGAHLTTEAGRRFGLRKLGRIDVCDPAGPAFDVPNLPFAMLDPKLAARNVQCIHTSQVGVKRRTCHQNWNMGECGLRQPGADIVVAHTLCPKFYNSAFRNKFRAVPNPARCAELRPVVSLAADLRMGYFSDVQSGVTGDLFALTTITYPYNVIDAQ